MSTPLDSKEVDAHVQEALKEMNRLENLGQKKSTQEIDDEKKSLNDNNKETNSDNISINVESSDDKEPKEVTKNTLLGVIIVFFSVFLDFMGMSVVQPILPFFAEKFNASSTQLGGLYSSYAGMSLVATYMMGKMSDKYGRKLSILYSLFGTCIGYILNGLAWNYNTFLITRLICGSFGGSAPVAMAYISDVIPKKSRPQYLAMVGAVMAMAFIIGPGLGSGLGELGIRVPFFVSGGLGGIGFIFALIWLEESHPKILAKRRKKNDTTIEEELDETDKKPQISDPIAKEVYYLFITFFIAFLGWTAYTSMYALYMLDKFGLESLHIGFTSLALALVLVLANIFGFGQLIKKIGLYKTCCIGFILQAIGMGLCTLYDNVWYNLSFMIFFVGCGDGLIVPASTAMLAEYSTLSNRGKVMAFGNSSSGLAFVIGPMLHGVFFAIQKSYPFLFGCLFSIVSLFLLFIFMIKNNKLQKVGLKEQQRIISNETWTYIEENPTQNDYLKLGNAVGKLLTKRHYLWVKYFDKVYELFDATFLPLRINSLEDHIKDVYFITQSQKQMQHNYKLFENNIDIKFG